MRTGKPPESNGSTAKEQAAARQTELADERKRAAGRERGRKLALRKERSARITATTALRWLAVAVRGGRVYKRDFAMATGREEGRLLDPGRHASSQPPSDQLTDELTRLASIRMSVILTDAEFQAAKAIMIASQLREAQAYGHSALPNSASSG